MSGIDLTTAQFHLDAALGALTSARDAQTHAIGDRRTSRHELREHIEEVRFWRREVARLTRGSDVGAHRVVVNG